MTAQPAEMPEVLELDTSRIYQFPRTPEPMNPITAEPVEYQAPPDAVIPKPKRQRSAKGKGGRPKGSRNKKDIIAAAHRRAEELAARAPAANAAPAPTSLAEAGAAPVPTSWMAAVLNTGSAGPRRTSKLALGDRIWLVCVGVIIAAAVVASAYFVGVIRVQ